MKKLLGLIFIITSLVVLAACKGEDLKPTVTALESQKSQLQSQVQGLQSDKSQLQAEVDRLRELAGPLPAALDDLYPPKAPAPLWLLQMFAQGNALIGLVIDLMVEQDMANVPAGFEKFKEEYAKTRDMAPPEWKDKLPQGPVDAFGQALATGDPAQIGAAFEALGAVCGECHLVNQVKVAQKYHWFPFSAVQVTNPITNETKAWVDFMFDMAFAFDGIGHDLGQGQLDKAQQNFQGFQVMFNTMAGACSACHTTPRLYFVSDDVKGAIADLGKALSAPAPDPAAIGGLLGMIGQESCGKCHLVHFPAARAQAVWELALPK
ncbi:MAG: hypothetical protein HY676_05825 [Chloroflexi bacterium]|nr:hypothetical protein [Chloroflexota bacterium]